MDWHVIERLEKNSHSQNLVWRVFKLGSNLMSNTRFEAFTAAYIEV
jgi:hypothetical protein